jgi:enoyl-CoA hydratase/carnithine racemase
MLPRIIGFGRASELLFLGRSMNGEEAERWGFYNKLCEPENVLSEAAELAASLAHGPTAAHAITKRCLNAEYSMDIDEALDYEAQMQAQCMMTEDFERAYRAFLAKKPPVFEGN